MADEVDDESTNRRFSPTEFMRARRPYLFSDTREVAAAELSREVFSYHLETLTNQKDETAFEHFAQRLAQRFIAPNIRPQTGPTAGGDGKSDAETYPVASVIAARWFVGDPNQGSERMAFAFSAEKGWRAKVRSDVRALAETSRPYGRIYFVTNQYVPAKESANVQDDLERAYNIPVTILDKTWLLDRVLNDNSIDVAVDTLGLPEPFRESSRFSDHGTTSANRNSTISRRDYRLAANTPVPVMLSSRTRIERPSSPETSKDLAMK